MKTQKHVAPKQKPRPEFVEPERSIACTRKIRKRILANLREACYCHVGKERAGRARQILGQIEAEQAAAERRNRDGQLAAAALPPSPAVPQTLPQGEQRRQLPAPASVKQGITTVTRWVKKAWAGRWTRG
jgi:hypothetical protein